MIKMGFVPRHPARHPASCLPTFSLVLFHKPRARASHSTLRGSTALGRGVRTAPEPRPSSPRVASSGRARGRGARLPGGRGQVLEARTGDVQVAQLNPLAPFLPLLPPKPPPGSPPNYARLQTKNAALGAQPLLVLSVCPLDPISPTGGRGGGDKRHWP